MNRCGLLPRSTVTCSESPWRKALTSSVRVTVLRVGRPPRLNSHVSLLKFCQFTFGLDPLTDRDAASNGMTDCIDASQQPNAHP
ncbi:MAG: hypothetical protein ACLP4W_20055 [Mycobacterium sp.]|uniref:hypothetical protein n=1 Tax=Mycobacterium sp. TaxID=1785 RepID=UPI003F98263E